MLNKGVICMEEKQIRIITLIKQGYTCSQILMVLYLESVSKQNTELVQAFRGLSYGMGLTGNSCGLLAGGACLIHLLPVVDIEEEKSILVNLTQEYISWFEEKTKEYGSANCKDILKGLCDEEMKIPNCMYCSELIFQSWLKILTLFDTYK